MWRHGGHNIRVSFRHSGPTICRETSFYLHLKPRQRRVELVNAHILFSCDLFSHHWGVCAAAVGPRMKTESTCCSSNPRKRNTFGTWVNCWSRRRGVLPPFRPINKLQNQLIPRGKVAYFHLRDGFSLGPNRLGPLAKFIWRVWAKTVYRRRQLTPGCRLLTGAQRASGKATSVPTDFQVCSVWTVLTIHFWIAEKLLGTSSSHWEVSWAANSSEPQQRFSHVVIDCAWNQVAYFKYLGG